MAGREEEGGGELHEPKISVSVARFVQYSPQATQIPKGSAGNGLGFENGPNEISDQSQKKNVFFAVPTLFGPFSKPNQFPELPFGI